MPTPCRTFAAVAHTLAGVDPDDGEAVTTFYRRRFTGYAPAVRALISDFLIGSEDLPSQDELDALKRAVEGPAEDIPDIQAPIWDEQDGPAMAYAEPVLDVARHGGGRDRFLDDPSDAGVKEVR